MTYLFDIWPTKSTGQCAVLGFIWGLILVMIDWNLRPISRKMQQFNLNINIEGQIWHHAVTSSVTSSTSKVLFSGIIFDDLSISDAKLNLSEIFQIFKMAAILRSGRFLQNGSCTGSWAYIKIGHAYPYFWAFVRLSSSKIDVVMAVSIWHTFWPRDLIIWPLT